MAERCEAKTCFITSNTELALYLSEGYVLQQGNSTGLWACLCACVCLGKEAAWNKDLKSLIQIAWGI